MVLGSNLIGKMVFWEILVLSMGPSVLIPSHGRRCWRCCLLIIPSLSLEYIEEKGPVRWSLKGATIFLEVESWYKVAQVDAYTIYLEEFGGDITGFSLLVAFVECWLRRCSSIWSVRLWKWRFKHWIYQRIQMVYSLLEFFLIFSWGSAIYGVRVAYVVSVVSRLVVILLSFFPCCIFYQSFWFLGDLLCAARRVFLCYVFCIESLWTYYDV